jgi:hypothetical protein
MTRPTRICGKCGLRYIPTGRRQRYCPTCGSVRRREYVRKYNGAHQEQRRAYYGKYRRAHRKQRRAYERKYYERHPEKQRARGSKWYQTHRAERVAYSRKYRADNPETVRATKRKYNRSHPEKAREQSRRRYKRTMAQLAELRSLRQPRPRRGRGRQPGMLPATRASITVAASRVLAGETKYKMARLIYPRQHDVTLAYKSTKELFRRYQNEIETEKLRLAALSESDREREINTARAQP